MREKTDQNNPNSDMVTSRRIKHDIELSWQSLFTLTSFLVESGFATDLIFNSTSKFILNKPISF